MSALKDRIAVVSAEIEFLTRLKSELTAADTSDVATKAVRSYSGKRRGRKPRTTAALGTQGATATENIAGWESPTPEYAEPQAEPAPLDIPTPDVVTKPRRMRAAPSKMEESSAASEAAI